MSAFRAHFSSGTSSRSSKSDTNPGCASATTPSIDGSTRYTSRLAKKSSTQTTASQQPARVYAVPSTTLPTMSPGKTAAQTRFRSQMPASGTTSKDVLSPPTALRTPSLVSGSSVSTFDSPRSNVLRRKPSSIAKFVASKRSGALELDRSTMHSRNENYTEAMDDSVFGIAMPHSGIPPSITPYSIVNSESQHTTYSAAISNTPSTRYTDSPFSHVPTPSSFSSQSTVPMLTRDGHKLSQEMSRDMAVSPIESMRQEKASRRTSVTPAREMDTWSETSSRLAYTGPMHASKFESIHNKVGSRATGAQQSSKRRSIIPPELAHLSGPSTRNATKPTRPSREGTAALNIAQPTSPVVQSDLPPATFHKRTSSRDSLASSSSHGFRNRFGLSPKPTLDRSSPRMSNIIPSTGSDGASIDAAGDVNSRVGTSQRGTPSPAPSPAPSRTRTFGLFSRKPKDEATKLEKPKREARKMPTAGTGHERYGRFGFGHKNSSVSSSIGGRSPSTESLTSNKSTSFLRRKSSGASDKTSELDEFLRDRLSPVVLRGSGSNSSTATTPLMGSTPSTFGSEDRDNALGLTQSFSHRESNMNQSSRASDLTRPAYTRSEVAAVESPGDNEHGNLQRNILSAKDGNEGMWLRPLVQEKKPVRKWNFLQRLQSSPARSRSGVDTTSPPVFDLHRTNFDNAAHSALMDAIKPIALDEVEKLVLEDGLPSPPTQRGLQPCAEDNRRRSLLPSPMTVNGENQRFPLRGFETRHADMVFPTKPLVQSPDSLLSRREVVVEANNAEQQLHTPELNGSDSPRLPRLSPIGRIPQVVSKRDRDRRLPDVSFSRPFASTQPRPNVKPPGALYNQIRDLASPAESAAPDLSSTKSDQEPFAAIQASKRSSRSEYASRSTANLFAFPQRKNSALSYSSSSDTASWMAYSRMQALQDEDVWDEYDDLIDDASLGKPSMYHKASFSPHHQSPPIRGPTTLPDTSYFGLPPTREPSSALPKPPRPSRENSSTSISKVGQQSMYSLTQAVLSRQSTISGTSIDSSRNSHLSTRSRAASFNDANVRSSHTSFSSSGRGEPMKAQSIPRHEMYPSVNLKLEALMTSKLLSFGRVLFSPAHNEMRLADEPRVLILDGLGSDWSYFVAMFYPQATIYNLGPSAKQAAATRDGLQQLTNHRNIAHTALGDLLPFPRGFFTAAVFRFPIATTDAAYHSCIAEFKRVLRPGGHLEVTVLDIDLCNAGDRARKAVRGLKTRVQQRQESISLRSLSDFVHQSIGKRGFEEVQRCAIGVPVMSRGSRDKGVTYEMPTGRLTSDASKAKAGSDFADSAQHQEAADEGSDEKLARVGRWWYSQCYERQVLSTDQSIWADDSLLHECQQQGTTFRLFICCAQKPTQARRRTMSV